MWHALVDWGLGMKDELDSAYTLSELLERLKHIPAETEQKVHDSQGDALITVYYLSK